MGYQMYAYADARDVKNITVTSIASFRNEISEKTPSGNGAITRLASDFKHMKTPAPFKFTWKPEKLIPKTLFTALKYGEEFTLELRIKETGDNDKLQTSFHFDFHQCKFMKARMKGDKVTVEATYGHFSKSPD